MSQPSDLLKGIPITDDHVHFRPDGQMETAIRDFRRHGGRRLLLVHTPYEDLTASDVGSFEPGFERTLALAKRARQIVDMEVHVALGPHPVEVLGLKETAGLQEAVEVMKSGLRAASRLVQQGHAVAIGEIGRPHFPVDDAVWNASNELMSYGMKLAKEVDCAVILHTETATPNVFRELVEMADGAGLPREKVVKHHSGPVVLPRENYGIFPSILARWDRLVEAARKRMRFLMETDYLDDPRRPGAVLGLATVPRRCARLLREGLLSEEDLYKVHADNVRDVYGTLLSGEL